MKKNIDYHALLGEGNPLLRYPHLYEAALNEFSQKNYEDASLNDILKNAGMSKGSLYHNFGDKFGLYLTLMDILFKRKINFFTPILVQLQNSGDFFGTIKHIIRATVEFMLKDERLHKLSSQFIMDNSFKNTVMKFFPYDLSLSFSPLITSAIESGQIDSRYSPYFIENLFGILISNYTDFIPKNCSKEDVLSTIDQLIDCMQFGISKKKEE
ncbi:UNVERIFIED_CONTAM: TetR family transcriptional regulator [Acetivibrio alkalicellulosi]